MPNSAPRHRLFLKMAGCLALAVVLAACGGGGGAPAGGSSGGDGKPANASHAFSGVVSGLSAGLQLKVQLNGSEALTVGANGPYSFVASLPVNSSYSVTVTQPAGQTCSVANFSGAGLTGDVSNLNIVCASNTYALGGSVSGLAAGAQLTLNNNGGDPLVVSADGSVRFAQRVPYNGSYVVTVAVQPAGQTCTVGNATGSGVTSDVGTVAVTCAAKTYRIAGTVAGLAPGVQLTLANNGDDPQIVTADGAFAFTTPVAHNGSYSVTVGAQPAGQVCTVNNGAGAGVTDDVGNVGVMCSTASYVIGGTVSGLTAGQQVTLVNNNANATTLSSNGAFSFSTPVAHGSGFFVMIATQPAAQTCAITGPQSATGVMADVSNIAIVCGTNSYSVGGMVTGLAPGRQLTLVNDGADLTVVAANGNYILSTLVVHGGSYSVSVGTQPAGQVCTVSNPVAAGIGAPVTHADIQCVAQVYAYVALAASDSIGQFIVGSDGRLQPMPVASVAADDNPMAIAVDPTGRYAYAANLHSGTVSQYLIGLDGSLGPMSSAAVASGAGARAIAIERTGQYVYVANSVGNTISQYRIRLDGSLEAMAQPTVATGDSPRSIAVDPSGRYVYVANYTDGSVSQYGIGPDGALSAIGGPAAANSAYAVAVDPGGRFVYVAGFSSNIISQFAIGPGGALGAVIAEVATGAQPQSIAFDAMGRFAYVANANSDDLSQFTVDAGTGALAAMSQGMAPAGDLPSSIALDPTGRFAYASNFDGSIRAYSVAALDGALAPLSTTNGLDDPQGIAMATAR